MRAARIRCCHSAVTRVSIVSITLASLISLSTPPSVFALALPEWKVRCREAFVLQNDLRFSEAYSKYNDALNKLGSVDNENTREIQLNMAVMLRLSGQPRRSLVLLQTLTPRFANDKSSLQAMRYWRRLRDVQHDLRDVGHAIEAQRKILAIANQHFELGSPIYTDETRRMIDLLGEAMQLPEAAALATQLNQYAAHYSADSRERFTSAIEVLNSRVIKTAQDLRDQGKFKESLDMLHLIKGCLNSTRYLQELSYLGSAPMPFEPKLKEKIQLEIKQLAASAQKTKAKNK
ncbi:MAG: hypothetical protein SGJ27_29805 [Candidatus Melainabacteria bacterium]|nr:hypothetical protein [Candidatus Melainabacteria bacterium]